MSSSRLLSVDRQGDACFVRLKNTRIEELEIHQLGNELIALCERDGCRHLALSLGPEAPNCLYSVFLAKLIAIRNALRKLGAEFVLCEVGPIAANVFDACRLTDEFIFAADFAVAKAHFAGS